MFSLVDVRIYLTGYCLNQRGLRYLCLACAQTGIDDDDVKHFTLLEFGPIYILIREDAKYLTFTDVLVKEARFNYLRPFSECSTKS